MSGSSHSRARLSELAVKLRHEPRAVQRFVSRKGFSLLERLGFHVVGNHFYEPIPDLREVDRWWSDSAKPCHGVDLRFDESEQYLAALLDHAGGFSSVYEFGFRDANPSYTSLDALTLYCFLRRERPPTVVEVGQGWSTRVIVAALTDNHRDGSARPRLITVDPHPRIEADSLESTISIETVRRPVQDAADLVLGTLASGDLFFVDSSHVHKPGSDVEAILDELVPRVPVGTHVHLHDIYTPFRYPRDWYARDKRFWNEAEHLEGFLRFNRDFRVTLPLHHLIRSSELLAAWWSQERRLPAEGSAFYLRRTAG